MADVVHPGREQRVRYLPMFLRICAIAALLIAVVQVRTTVMDLFPRIDLVVGELMLIALLLGVGTIVQQVRAGRRYSLLVIYTAIFLSEFVVGTFVAAAKVDILWRQQLSSASIAHTLSIAVVGYVLFLVAYHVPLQAAVPGAPREHRRTASDFPVRYRIVLFCLMTLMTALGFVQLALRVKKAGSFAAYLAIAYTLRIGTYAETDAANAWAVLASLFASGALPAAALLFVAWMRGKLTTFEKWLFLALTVALLGRQASTAFRAVVIFTLFSVFAVYDSERRIGAKKLALLGVVILSALVGVNYLHVILHSLTGVGAVTNFADSSKELLAPHAYLETLARLIEVRDRMIPLDGKGIFTSLLFFVPRAVWLSKLPSEAFGTGLVQAWAGFPTTYQIAISNVGELFVHFGYAGLVGMLAWGLVYRWFDARWHHGLEWRVVLLCISAPRVFADEGMGISALAITVVSVACFMVSLNAATRIAGLGSHRTDV